jgi:metal-responsive CopG/Arc/MetJ family transcriptional regulator
MRMAVRIATNLSLPRDLVEELDSVAGKRNRSAFVEEAIRHRLRREHLRRMIEETAGSLDTGNYPEWETSEDVVAWVRARRAEETDPGPDV